MLRRLAGLTLGAGAASLGWALFEAQWYRLRTVTVPVLPQRSPEVRVLHVSDFHLLPSQRKKLAFIRDLAALDPHLIVNTGDNISSSEAIDALDDAWGPLKEVPGVFVFGSNDYEAPVFKNPLKYVSHGRSEKSSDTDIKLLPTELLKASFEANGWVDLTHRRHTMDVRGLRFELRGTDDAHHDRDDYSTVQGPPAIGADLAIGVTHAPYRRLLDAMTADGVDLIFAGHTHGGQVCVPGHGALTTNCDLETSRVKGLSAHRTDENMSWLHVSGGLGTSPFAPIRLACRPEVCLVTLAPRS